MAYRDLDHLIRDARGAESPSELERTQTREAVSRRIGSGEAAPRIERLSTAPARAGLGSAVAVPAGIGLLVVGAIVAYGLARQIPSVPRGTPEPPATTAPASPEAASQEAPTRGAATDAPLWGSELDTSSTGPRLPHATTLPSTHHPDPKDDAPVAPNDPTLGNASRGSGSHGSGTGGSGTGGSGTGGRVSGRGGGAVLRSTKHLSGKAAPESRGEAERRSLALVQSALRHGAFMAALARLETDDQRFAGGALVAERAAARVFAVCGNGSGDIGKARQLARDFVGRYPSSPLRARVLASCPASDQGPSR